jgi:hypothetical protein
MLSIKERKRKAEAERVDRERKAQIEQPRIDSFLKDAAAF